MKTRQRACAITAGALLTVMAATPALAAEPTPTPTVPATVQEQLDALVDPSTEVLTAKDELLRLSKDAEASAVKYTDAKDRRATALALEKTANKQASDATVRADDARAKLGNYAASAYISGGSSAGVAATLTSTSPTELVSRQNTLNSVADNTTDLLRVLRQAEADAATARSTAQKAAADATTATSAAEKASADAAKSAADAQSLLTGLVAVELDAQTQELAEAALRARVASYAAGAGSGLVNAQGDPVEYLALGNGNIPLELLGPIGDTGHRLWPPAASAMERLLEAARADGITIGITDSYRTLESQLDLVARKGLYSQGGLAATPGTSDHGWGTAVDLDLNSAALAWMRSHAATYGFVEDVPREPWHWHFLPFE